MVSDFAKTKVIWTREMNLDLAKYLEDKPHIWDQNHPKFSSIGLRDETFAEFASQYEDLSWQAVKDRWTNIRSTYGFYMRKINARKAKGQDFKVGWFMWKPCKYLYNVHKMAKTKNGNHNAVDDNANASNDVMENSDSENGATDNLTCQGIVRNIATIFTDVQNDSFTIDQSKYAAIGEAVTAKLSQLNSYDAAQLSQKILEILAEYDGNNPMNPNNT